MITVMGATGHTGKGRRPENTTPTGFEDFAGDLARAYQAGH